MVNENIATVLAAIIALGLALQAGVGPVVMLLTESIKDAFRTPSGSGGIISVFVGVLLGILIGCLTAMVTPDSGLGTYGAFGAVAGLFMGAGAIRSYKASADINTSGSVGIANAKADKAAADAGGPIAEYHSVNTSPGSFAREIRRSYLDGLTEGTALQPASTPIPPMEPVGLWDTNPEAGLTLYDPAGEAATGAVDASWLPYMSNDAFSGREVPFGEAPDAEDDYDYTAARTVGGHTGEAKAADPLPDVGEPGDDYKGDGPPPAVSTIYEAR
jgi:hypothetical protein